MPFRTISDKNSPRFEEVSLYRVDFFNRINLLYGLVSDCCTNVTCPIMLGGPKYEYLWCDNESYKKPTRLLMNWIEKQINDENVFRATISVPFPKNVKSVCKKMLSRFFRVFLHVYIHHFDASLRSERCNQNVL